MSSITINSNLASLTTQRRLGDTTAGLTRSFERLSSGLRINRASDDAAGLAIADNLKTDNRVFKQGIRNLNDGLSLLNVADGALTELSNIVVRIRELAEQSANGTLSNTQREAIDQEAQELSDEFTRIARTTEVNGLKLFDGSLGELSLQAGYGQSGAVVSDLGGAVSDGTFGAFSSYESSNNPVSIQAADFNADGILDVITASPSDGTISISIGNGDGSFQESAAYNTGGASRQISIADFNGDGALDAVTANGSDNTISVLLNDGDGGFSLSRTYNDAGGDIRDIETADFDGDGVTDIASSDGNNNAVSILLGNGDGTFGATNSFATFGASPQALTSGDFNGDGIIDLVTADGGGDVEVLIGVGDGTFSSLSTFAVGNNPLGIEAGDFNGDGVLDLVTANYADTTATVLIGQGDGTFSGAVSYSTGNNVRDVVVGDLNDDGNLDFASVNRTDASLGIYFGSGDGTFADAATLTVGSFPSSAFIADVNGDGVSDLLSASETLDDIVISLGNTTSGVGSLLPFSLATKSDALQAMASLDRKIEQLALQKGTIGAFQSRVETAINNLQITSTNISAAESRIRDVDVAFESAKLTRLNILQQAGAAVLAQANQAPALALQLLI